MGIIYVWLFRYKNRFNCFAIKSTSNFNFYILDKCLKVFILVKNSYGYLNPIRETTDRENLNNKKKSLHLMLMGYFFIE